MILFNIIEIMERTVTILLFILILITNLVDSQTTSVKKKKIVQKVPRIRIQTNRTQIIPPTIKQQKIFADANFTQIDAQKGSTSKLDCEVENSTYHVNVSWYKIGIEDPLTFNSITKHKDKRYLAKKMENTNHWVLLIRYTSNSDEGLYQCVIEGDVNSSLILNLTLIRAYTQIKISPNDPKPGDPVRLSCALKDSIEAPSYIFWYKDDRVINYDLDSGGTIREGRQGSELIFFKATSKLSGNYSCVPSNADSSTVEVII